MARNRTKNTYLNGLNPLAYLGDNSYNPPQIEIIDRAPTVNDYDEFEIGALWVNPSTNAAYILVNKDEGVATWEMINGGGGGDVDSLTGDSGGPINPDIVGNINVLSGTAGVTFVGTPLTNTLTLTTSGGGSLLQTLTGDSGGAVQPDASGNISVLGTSNLVVTTGNPGTNTITWDIGGEIANQYVCNTGTAVPALNILNVLGVTGIETTGSSNNLEISVDGSVPTSYVTDSGTATTVNNIINVIGAGGTTTSAAGNTITIDSTASGTLSTLHTDDGNDVTPTAGVINVVGTHGLNTTGTVGPNTATWAINNAITLGDLSNIAAGSSALTAQTGDISIIANAGAGNLNLPTTASANAGVVNYNGNRFIHQYGTNNLFVGDSSGNFTLTGNSNACVGKNALQSLTTGIGCVGIGLNALTSGTSCDYTVAIGLNSMVSCTTGDNNVGIGLQAGNYITTGRENLFLGTNSGAAIGFTTGEFNTIIGTNTGRNYTSSESGNITIGSPGGAGESSTIRIGNFTIDSFFPYAQTAAYMAGIWGQTSSAGTTVYINSSGKLGTTTSSIKYKDNVQDVSNSDLIYKLRPVEFNYKDLPDELSYGLIAEEVAKIDPDLVIYHNDQPETVRYQYLPILLLKEIQKLRKELDELKSKLASE